jgi:hypothetical protein
MKVKKSVTGKSCGAASYFKMNFRNCWNGWTGKRDIEADQAGRV